MKAEEKWTDSSNRENVKEVRGQIPLPAIKGLHCGDIKLSDDTDVPLIRWTRLVIVVY